MEEQLEKGYCYEGSENEESHKQQWMLKQVDTPAVNKQSEGYSPVEIPLTRSGHTGDPRTPWSSHQQLGSNDSMKVSF